MIAALTLAGALLAPIPVPTEFITCTINLLPVAFGEYVGGLRTATGTIQLICTGNGTTFYTATLSTGASGNYTARTMVSGTHRLFYNLYQDPSYRQIWGDGTGFSTTVEGKIQMQNNAFVVHNLAVYGRVLTQITPLPGVYSDTIVVTVNY
jgi:spore coat protein U-like protein